MKIISKEQIEALAAEVAQLDAEGHQEAADRVQDHMLDDLVEYAMVAPEAQELRDAISDQAPGHINRLNHLLN
jgi:phosphate uptake regulator